MKKMQFMSLAAAACITITGFGYAADMQIYAAETQNETKEETMDDADSKERLTELNAVKEGQKNESDDADSSKQDAMTYVKISEIPDMQWLNHLLKQIRISYGENAFTSEYMEQEVNVIQKLVGHPGCVCFYDYPIIRPESFYDKTEVDPRGYINDRYNGRWYVKTPGSSVEWVAKNILHFDRPAIDSWSREEDDFYYQDGYYHAFHGGIGDDFRYPEIVGAFREDDRYYVYYNYVPDPEMFHGMDMSKYPSVGVVAEVAYETIDGYDFWTIYKETFLGHEATAEEVYHEKADEYADCSGIFDFQVIENKEYKNPVTQASDQSSSGNTASAADTTKASDASAATSFNRNNGFYGIWVGAFKNEENAEAQLAEAKSKGFPAEIFITTDWENLNPEPFYVVTAGVYETQTEAERYLTMAQDHIIPDAYVKYSGKHK